MMASTSFGHKPVEYVIVQDKNMISKTRACDRMGGFQINKADTVIVVMVKTANKQQAEFWIEDGAITSSCILLAVKQLDLEFVGYTYAIAWDKEKLLMKR